jgi:hypothetical protein
VDNYSYHYALYVPPPTELGFPLTLQPDAVLRFSAGLSRETRPGHAARFEVQVRADGSDETLWSRTLTATPDEWLWHPAEVDLSEYAGQAVELVLRTTAEVGDPHPLWSNPVVDSPAAGPGPRNVILIAVDTLRADRMSGYGYAKPTSPRLDALAERFRAHGWSTNSIAYKAPLYSSGYDQGFDVSFNVPRKITRADDNLAEAMQWLDANADRRNFLFLHFNDPHQPFAQPAPYDQVFGPLADGISLPLNVESSNVEGLHDVASTLYDGAIAYVDDRIGAFVDALKDRGLYDDALIVFVSDHGEELWEHGAFGHSLGRLYDEAVRVPLIVKPPGKSPVRGRVVQTQVRAFDVMPTLLELAGIPLTGDIDAQSLVPLLTRDGPDRLAVIETRSRGFAVRSRNWKYMLESWRKPMPAERLFDLQADPGETEDVAADRPDIVERMRLAVLDYRMLNRPGRYVAVIRKGSAATEDTVLRDVTAAYPIYGLAPVVDEDGVVRFEGTPDGPLVLVAHVRTPGPIRVGDADSSPQTFIRYTPGDLPRLVRDAREGVYLFEGPPAVAEAARPLQSMDQQQLDALRAPGYLGGDEEGGTNR